MVAKAHGFLGLGGTREACVALRKSLLMLANNFRVGTRFNSPRFSFASNGELL